MSFYECESQRKKARERLVEVKPELRVRSKIFLGK